MDIVKTKSEDLNARDDEAAFRIIAGTPDKWASKSSINRRLVIVRLRSPR